MHTLLVAAHKGGVGKSSVAVNLAAGVALSGRAVLLVDCDPQSAAASFLGLSPQKPSLYEALLRKADIRQTVVATNIDGLNLIPSDESLADAEAELPPIQGWQRSLQRLLKPLDGVCDLVVIDSPPGHGVLSLCAAVAATDALVVTTPDLAAQRTLGPLTRILAAAHTPIVGIVINQASTQTGHAIDVADTIRAEYGDLMLSPIPARVAFRYAQVAGMPIQLYAPRSDAAAAITTLVEEVLHRVAVRTPNSQ